MSWNVIGGITWSKVTPFYLFISFYIFLNLFISFYIFLYRFSGEKMFFMILNVIFWFLDHQNHVVSNLLRPAALFSLADICVYIYDMSTTIWRFTIPAAAEFSAYALHATPATLMVYVPILLVNTLGNVADKLRLLTALWCVSPWKVIGWSWELRT